MVLAPAKALNQKHPGAVASLGQQFRVCSCLRMPSHAALPVIRASDKYSDRKFFGLYDLEDLND